MTTLNAFLILLLIVLGAAVWNALYGRVPRGTPSRKEDLDWKNGAPAAGSDQSAPLTRDTAARAMLLPTAKSERRADPRSSPTEPRSESVLVIRPDGSRQLVTPEEWEKQLQKGLDEGKT